MAGFDPNAEDPARSAAKAAALSGAISGGALGLGTAVLGGKRKLLELLKASLIGGGAASALAGGATYAGSKLLGAPDPDDDSAYTTRGAVGGALGAGSLGALAGASLLVQASLSENSIGCPKRQHHCRHPQKPRPKRWHKSRVARCGTWRFDWCFDRWTRRRR